MAPASAERETWRAFAAMLSYPGAGVEQTARACAAGLAARNPEASTLVEAFAALVAETSPGDLEEIYTATFDLGGAGYPYVGYHLFGESYKRSVFLVRLKEQYRACGLDLGSELPDHVAALMGLLAASDDDEFAGELITAALVPALDRMLGGPRPDGQDGDEATVAEALMGEGGVDSAEPPPPEEPPGRLVYRGLLRALRLSLPECPVPVTGGTDAGTPVAP